jgi:hypothetical protein
MKKFNPLFFIFIIFSIVLLGTSSCSGSKKTHRQQGQSFSPVTTKDSPVPKKYIIRNKKNRILGNERPNR